MDLKGQQLNKYLKRYPVLNAASFATKLNFLQPDNTYTALLHSQKRPLSDVAAVDTIGFFTPAADFLGYPNHVGIGFQQPAQF